ncbi:MAG: LpxI family protein [Atribacterota bacterium]|nr:LpxI family protein [Atribacterota bacterium]
MSEKMLLLTGEGKIPLLVYQKACLSSEVLVLSSSFLRPENGLPIHFLCSSFSVSEIVHLAKMHGIRRVCLAGKVPKKMLFQGSFLAQEVEKISPSFADKIIIEKVMVDFVREGLEIVSPLAFLAEYLTPPGVLTRRIPDSQEWSDIALGFRVAKLLADEEIGQTVVVRKGTVLSLEGAEGTDEAIQRGLRLGCGGVVVKVARSNQDFFVDVPVIGLQTVEILVRLGGQVLAVESGKTLFLDRDEAIAQAETHSLSIVGIEKQNG